jgi:diadenosine tetraphosphate (Ap4A) HIT family hydrolase
MIVKDFLGNQWDTDCLGCDIGNSKIIPPGGLIYESRSFVMHQDPEIPIHGFLMVATKDHISSTTQLSANQRYEMMDIMSMGINTIKKLGITDEVTIVQEERSKHLHLWLFPWHMWMENRFDKSISSLRNINKFAKDNASNEDKNDVVFTANRIKQRLS